VHCIARQGPLEGKAGAFERRGNCLGKASPLARQVPLQGKARKFPLEGNERQDEPLQGKSLCKQGMCVIKASELPFHGKACAFGWQR
jgi:hypothetical protein